MPSGSVLVGRDGSLYRHLPATNRGNRERRRNLQRSAQTFTTARFLKRLLIAVFIVYQEANEGQGNPSCRETRCPQHVPRASGQPTSSCSGRTSGCGEEGIFTSGCRIDNQCQRHHARAASGGFPQVDKIFKKRRRDPADTHDARRKITLDEGDPKVGAWHWAITPDLTRAYSGRNIAPLISRVLANRSLQDDPGLPPRCPARKRWGSLGFVHLESGTFGRRIRTFSRAEQETEAEG